MQIDSVVGSDDLFVNTASNNEAFHWTKFHMLSTLILQIETVQKITTTFGQNLIIDSLLKLVP